MLKSINKIFMILLINDLNNLISEIKLLNFDKHLLLMIYQNSIYLICKVYIIVRYSKS